MKTKLPTEAEKIRLMVLNNNMLLRRRMFLSTIVSGTPVVGGVVEPPPLITVLTSDASPNQQNPFTLTITFSQEVTGFVVGDITALYCSLSSFSTSNNIVFTCTVTPTAGETRTMLLSVAASVCTSVVGGLENQSSNQLSITQFIPTEFEEFTTSGTWTSPAGIIEAIWEAWAGGGGGGGRSSSGQSGAGGGGAYAYKQLAITSSTGYSYTVGAGGAGGIGNVNGVDGGNSLWVAGADVLAEGGKLGIVSTTGGAGGLAANSVGTIKYNGGAGGSGGVNFGGSGGGGAGSMEAGTAGVSNSPTFGIGGARGGGNGGAGVIDANGNNGSVCGGGGSGVRRTAGTRTGGSGASGKVKVTTGRYMLQSGSVIQAQSGDQIFIEGN